MHPGGLVLVQGV